MSERIPDVSRFVPARRDVREELLPDGRVALRRRKFGAFGSGVLRLFRISPDITVKMDTLGSTAWRAIDGRRDVAEVLAVLKAAFPDEEGLEGRLGAFLSTLVSNGLVELRAPVR